MSIRLNIESKILKYTDSPAISSRNSITSYREPPLDYFYPAGSVESREASPSHLDQKIAKNSEIKATALEDSFIPNPEMVIEYKEFNPDLESIYELPLEFQTFESPSNNEKYCEFNCQPNIFDESSVKDLHELFQNSIRENEDLLAKSKENEKTQIENKKLAEALKIANSQNFKLRNEIKKSTEKLEESNKYQWKLLKAYENCKEKCKNFENSFDLVAHNVNKIAGHNRNYLNSQTSIEFILCQLEIIKSKYQRKQNKYLKMKFELIDSNNENIGLKNQLNDLIIIINQANSKLKINQSTPRSLNESYNHQVSYKPECDKSSVSSRLMKYNNSSSYDLKGEEDIKKSLLNTLKKVKHTRTLSGPEILDSKICDEAIKDLRRMTRKISTTIEESNKQRENFSFSQRSTPNRMQKYYQFDADAL